MPSNLLQKLEKLGGAWRAFEQTLLAVLVVGMVFVSALQVILRNFFSTGIVWAEPVLGASLLWMTMIGALSATGARKHITVDLVAQFLPPRPRSALQAVTSLFAAVVCAFLTVAAIRYVQFQQEMGGMSLPSVPQWTLYVIVPVCFAMMTFRFGLHAVLLAARAAATWRPFQTGATGRKVP